MSHPEARSDQSKITKIAERANVPTSAATGSAGQNSTAQPQLLTLRELSQRSQLSSATLHRLKRQGKIPFYQPSGPRGKLLFPVDAVEQAAKAAFSNPSPTSPGTTTEKAHLSGPCPTWMNP